MASAPYVIASPGHVAAPIGGSMRVAVLEPGELLRCGLASILTRIDSVDEIECHRSLEALLDVIQTAPGHWDPDVVVLGCPPGGDSADSVRTVFPSTRVLELVAGDAPDGMTVAKAHADGYLMVHEVTETTLDGTLRAMMRGELPISRQIADHLLDSAGTLDRPTPPVHGTFNARERDVIELLLEGLSNQQIAHRLGISLHSAKRHVSAILRRVNSPSRAHFVATMLR